MNKLLDLYNELLELQRLAREGVSIDDVKVESIMQSIRQIHDQGVDNNPFLDKEQKQRRKDLYAKAVKEIVNMVNKFFETKWRLDSDLLSIK